MADQTFQVNCGFFDSVNNDRLYSAGEMNKPYKRIISNGVFATQQGTASTDLQVVSASSGMNIICKKGDGLFANRWFENTSDLTITVPNNNDVLPRRDSVIVQVDLRTAGRKGNIVYRTGTPNSSPQPPAIGTVSDVTEYRIANIYVAPGATAINNDAIVDLRGSSECPWITSLIQQVDTSTLYTQWQAAYQNYYNQSTQTFNNYLSTKQAQFNAFMQQLTEELNVTTNIVKYESHYTSQAAVSTVPINISGYDKTTDVLMVRVNKFVMSEGIDYTINSTSTEITLTTGIPAGQTVDFLVLKSLIAGDVQTVMQQLGTLNSSISGLKSDTGWINFSLESGSTSFDSTTTPGCRKYGNTTHIRGCVKGIDTVGSAICTLPTTMRPAQKFIYTSTAIKNNAISATVTLQIATNGVVSILAKSGTIPSDAMLSIATNFITDIEPIVSSADSVSY